jgi:tetratricopeptide (TPR) repeat protein
MSNDVEQQSQTQEFINHNLVKIVDKNGEFYGSGFFIEINLQLYCITCHHCIYALDQIFVERFEKRYPAKWLEEYSDVKKDIAFLKVDNCELRPLIYAREAMANFAVTIRGFSGEKISDFPEGVTPRKSSLSDSTTPFQVKEADYKGNNNWNTKPAVYVNVYECEGKFDRGFSGSPVCYQGPNKVVGIFTAKDDNFGYVIPIQTLLDKFEQDKLKRKESIKNIELQKNIDILEILATGNKLLDNKHYKTAIQKYDEILYQPNYLNALFYKAFALGKLKEHREAIKWYNLLLIILPNDLDALNDKGLELYDLGEYNEAIECYDKALAIDPNYGTALNNKGLALNNLGRYKESIECLDKALAIDPNNNYALSNKGWALGELGRYEDEIKQYDKVLETDPNDNYAFNNKGRALNNLGRYNEAIECYDKALAIDPNYGTALNNKGLALNNLGRYNEAIECLDKALAIDPNNNYALVNMGLTLSNLGRNEDAIINYDKSLVIDPSDFTAWNNKGLAYYGLANYPKAIESYDKAIELKADYAFAWYNKGVAYFQLARYNESIQSYCKATKINPNYYEAWDNKGQAYYELGEYSKAIESYNKAIEIQIYGKSSHKAALWFNRACSNAKMGKIEEALSDLENSIKIGGPKYLDLAEKEKDFNDIRNDLRFKSIIMK